MKKDQLLTPERAKELVSQGVKVVIRPKGTSLPWFVLDVWRDESPDDLEYRAISDSDLIGHYRFDV